MGFLWLGKKKEPGRGARSQPEAHTVYGSGIGPEEALSAARRNLPPNAKDTEFRTYDTRAEVDYRLIPVPAPARGYGAAALTPLQDMLYRGR